MEDLLTFAPKINFPDKSDLEVGKNVMGQRAHTCHPSVRPAPSDLYRTLAQASGPKVLMPFWLPESETVAETAFALGRSTRTTRSIVARYDLGRKVCDGQWRVSKVARALFADGEMEALDRYLRGDRWSEVVVAYYTRYVDPLPPWLRITSEKGHYRK